MPPRALADLQASLRDAASAIDFRGINPTATIKSSLCDGFQRQQQLISAQMTEAAQPLNLETAVEVSLGSRVLRATFVGLIPQLGPKGRNISAQPIGLGNVRVLFAA